ncbi:protein KTI12 homolog [Plodia interpunctella]|uniref:protein KTI12 homolog n=1 Tax=Plodia interpunctella TaxID=58824 RepID=UPI002367D8EF|nr:protein KTI12 homolog [Plodia interpunctella]
MPLIIICGTPVSGKTTRARELKEFFEKHHSKNVEIVSEEESIKKLGYDKNETYLDSQKEKRVRSDLKSEVIRMIGKDNVVILDGSNYIKGYRYELYCASKASKSTQCTVYTIRNHEEAWDDNKKRAKSEGPYIEEVFDALSRLRFEEPNPNSRWDSPLFTIQPTDALDMDAVYKVLFEKKPPPPNMSTQNPPLSSTNFLYELDKVTQEITQQILDAKKLYQSEVNFPSYNCTLSAECLNLANAQSIARLRRQFLTYAKQNHASENRDNLAKCYVRYLNNTLSD